MGQVSPEQVSSRELLVALSRGDVVSVYLWREIADIAARFPDEDDADDLMNALNRRLHELNYSTNLASAMEEYDAAIGSELGLWAGRYALFDDKGESYELHVADDKASVLGLNGEATEHDFSEGILLIRGSGYTFELCMRMPLTAEAMDDPKFDIALPCTPGQPRCEGTLSLDIGGAIGGATESRKVVGKRGCYSRAGVERTLDGDPASHWDGVYLLTYTDQETWTWAADVLTVCASRDEVESVALGDQRCTQPKLLNNTLESRFGSKHDSHLIGYFTEGPTGNVPRFFGQLGPKGKERPVTGYWTRPALAKSTEFGRVSAVARRALPPIAPTDDCPADARVLRIDVSKLPKHGNDYDVVILPAGVERNAYALILEFVNLPTHLDPVGEWRMVDASAGAQTFIDLRRDTRSGVPWLRATMGETQSAGFLTFTLEQDISADPNTGTGEASIRIPMKLEGASHDPIVVSPSELPPIVIRRKYNAGLSAAGGEPPLTWTGEGELPSGIQFDAITQTFGGTVTDENLALRTFPYLLKVTANPRVIMAPCVARINLRVELEISSSDAKSYSLDLVVGIMSFVGAIGVGAVQFMRRKWKNNALYVAARSAAGAAEQLEIPSKEKLIEAVTNAYTVEPLVDDAYEASTSTLERVETEIRSHMSECHVARVAVDLALHREALSAEKTKELQDRRLSLEEKIENYRRGLQEVSYIGMRIKSGRETHVRENSDFVRHIRGIGH